MTSKTEKVTDDSGAPVLNENDVQLEKEINNFKYWGSYQQGVHKPVIKQTATCENRLTYLVVTNT
jgi:hypothetical protein